MVHKRALFQPHLHRHGGPRFLMYQDDHKLQTVLDGKLSAAMPLDATGAMRPLRAITPTPAFAALLSFK